MADRRVADLIRNLAGEGVAGRVVRLCRKIADSNGLEHEDGAEQELLTAVRRLAAPGGSRGPEPRAWVRQAAGAVAQRVGSGTRRAEAVWEIAVHWRRLSDRTRGAIAASLKDEIAGVAAVLADHGDAEHRLAAASLFSDLPAGWPIAAVLRLADDPHQGVRRAAVRAIQTRLDPRAGAQGRADGVNHLELTEFVVGAGSVREREALEAVAEAVARVGPGAISRRGSALGIVLRDAEHPAQMALRAAIRASKTLDGATLVRLVAFDTLAPAAIDALASLGGSGGARLRGAVAASHLTLSPARERRLARSGRGDRLAADASGLTPMIESDPSGAARWCAAARAWSRNHANTDLMCDAWLAAKNPLARATLARTLAHSEPFAGGVRETLDDLAFDEDAHAARTALFALPLASHDAGVRRWKALARAPMPMTRDLASRTLRRRDPFSLLETTDPGADAAAARAALSRDPDGFLAALRGAITAGGDDSRVRAIMLCTRLDLARECEIELLKSAAGGPARVAASAVASLGSARTASARDALRASLASDDPRLRANAIEALERIGDGPSAASRVIEPGGASDQPPRVRANAARALARCVEPKLRALGLETLDAMLGDDRAEHRVSGLWLAGRLGRVESAQRVAELASRDDAPVVRERARATARRLLALMRA